jgi:DNA-binding GntR family transcriptional regulator
VDFAAAHLRQRIITGALAPGDRIIEQRLTSDLGISRPPLREALRILEREGLVLHEPRRGTIVTPLTLHDVYEIYTLRQWYEQVAVGLGVPVTDQALLDNCRASFAAMELAANAGDEPAHVEAAFAFHASIVGLSGHGRLENAYRSMQLQIQLCMAMNNVARAESMTTGVSRHRRLLESIEAGDAEAVLHELAHHGDRTFLDGIEDRLDGHSETALAWLRRLREGEPVPPA